METGDDRDHPERVRVRRPDAGWIHPRRSRVHVQGRAPAAEALRAVWLTLLGAAAALGTPACAHPPANSRFATVVAGTHVFHVEARPEDAESASLVAATLPRAAAAAARWGVFSSEVVITIHPTHQALASAVRRDDDAWFVAWARRASIDLQAPRSWNATEDEVRQLLAHELTHCIMYQSLASRRGARTRTIPVWFREGMASTTAGQEHKRVPNEAIWRYYRDRAAGPSMPAASDPLRGAEVTVASDPDFVYATAHEAFRFLLERYGAVRVREVIAGVRDGRDFPDAFATTLGVAVEDFERDFRRFAVAQISSPAVVAEAHASRLPQQ